MFEAALFFYDISRSLISFHQTVQRNCGRLSDGDVVLFGGFLKQIFTPGGKVLSKHIRNKCLDFSHMFIRGLMISFIMPIKCKIFILGLDARGQQRDKETSGGSIPVPWLLLSLTSDL